MSAKHRRLWTKAFHSLLSQHVWGVVIGPAFIVLGHRKGRNPVIKDATGFLMHTVRHKILLESSVIDFKGNCK